MSAPLVVNTKDGTCWTRRTVTSGGIALYAPEKIRTSPEFVMATEAELAEHGIVGSAFALPMPVAPEPQPRTMLDRARDALNARMAKDDLRLVLENVIGYAAWLEAERHSTNESLSEAAETLRANRDRIAQADAQRQALAERLRAGQKWRRGRNPELVSENYVSQSELREIFGIPLTAPWGDAEDHIVAYRNTDRPGVLLCREHGDGWAGLTPLTSQNLPDGGICTYGDPADPDDVCGRDVLIGGDR